MRKHVLIFCLLLGVLTPAVAQVTIHIGLPDVRIGINVSTYPQLVRIPGYPVYYAPRLKSNYFFYDGLYWAYRNGHWYASYWYNGPWALTAPHAVPLFILRVPLRYYHDRPRAFAGWRTDAPPRWGQVWGTEWEQQRSGWNTWNRRSAPAPAPLPVYQRQYSANRYPQIQQQAVLQTRNYRYQPTETVVRQFYQEQVVQRAAAAPAVAAPAPAAPVARRPAPQQRPEPQQQPERRVVSPAPEQPRVARPAPEPKAARPAPEQSARQAPEPQAARPAPEPKAARPAPEQRAARPAPEPKAERQAPEPRAARPAPEPKASRPAPEPKAARQAPQQHQAQPAPQPRAAQQQQEAPREARGGNEPKGDKGDKPDKQDKQDKPDKGGKGGK